MKKNLELSTLRLPMLNKIKPLFSLRFLKFCIVGASGVVVNLGALALLADALHIHTNLSSALAIEISINTNFLINEIWTFRDRRNGGEGGFRRWIQFHVVSLVGAILQLGVFVVANMCWLILMSDADTPEQYFNQGAGWLESYVLQPITNPPDVGYLKYLSQLFGIAAATFWNFFANFHWTWKRGQSETLNG